MRVLAEYPDVVESIDVNLTREEVLLLVALGGHIGGPAGRGTARNTLSEMFGGLARGLGMKPDDVGFYFNKALAELHLDASGSGIQFENLRVGQ